MEYSGLWPSKGHANTWNSSWYINRMIIVIRGLGKYLKVDNVRHLENGCDKSGVDILGNITGQFNE